MNPLHFIAGSWNKTDSLMDATPGIKLSKSNIGKKSTCKDFPNGQSLQILS